MSITELIEKSLGYAESETERRQMLDAMAFNVWQLARGDVSRLPAELQGLVAAFAERAGITPDSDPTAKITAYFALNPVDPTMMRDLAQAFTASILAHTDTKS